MVTINGEVYRNGKWSAEESKQAGSNFEKDGLCLEVEDIEDNINIQEKER